MRSIFVVVIFSALAGSQIQAATCNFDFVKEEFAGSALQQARCLLPDFPGREDRRSEEGGARDTLGEPLESVIGQPVTLDKAKIAAALEKAGLNNFAQSINLPLSRSKHGNLAKYFVIHDTSTPYKLRSFPADGSQAMLQLGATWSDGSWRAHSWVNRLGATRVTVDYGKRLVNPAVRLERDHPGLKGLFLHTELTQPRKSFRPAIGNDLIIPVPAFRPDQYKSLALLYVAASARAGKWLIPAFHIAIDKGISGAHDDPQHFDLQQFSSALAALIEELH